MVLITIARTAAFGVGFAMGLAYGTARCLTGHKPVPTFDLRPAAPTPAIEAQIRGALERHPTGKMRAVDVLTTDTDFAKRKAEMIALRRKQGYITPDPYSLAHFLQERHTETDA